MILSCHTKWRSWVSSVPMITLRNEKGPIWHSSWNQWKRYLGTVNGQCWKFQSCSEYIWLLDIWLQLQKCASVDTRFIEYHMLSLVRRRKVLRVWNVVSRSHIHQQHRKTKNCWLLNNRLIQRNKCLNWITLWGNNWCHMLVNIEENHI